MTARPPPTEQTRGLRRGYERQGPGDPREGSRICQWRHHQDGGKLSGLASLAVTTPGKVSLAGTVRSIVIALASIAASLVLAMSTEAQAQGWTIQSAKGTALKLNGEQWEEVAIGDTVVDGGIYRTMRGALIVLEGEGTLISLGSRSAIGIDLVTRGASILQYAGAVSVTIPEQSNAAISVRNAALSASATGTAFTVFFDGTAARVEVDAGTVRVADAATGAEIIVAAGDVASSSPSAPGVEVETADGAGATGKGSGIGGGNGNAGANGNNTGNGNGNGTGTGNTGGNGNSTGNGNGNGSGNGTGSGNGNSSGSGNSNSSGNGGNGNGGNGNGNGNGN